MSADPSGCPFRSHSRASASDPSAATSRRSLLVAAALLPVAVGAVGAATGGRAAATTTQATASGDAQRHYDRAARLAGDDPVSLALIKALSPDAVFPPGQAPAPIRVFDNVAMVNTKMVSAAAITTSAGVVLLDALSSPEEAEQVLLPGLRAVGVDPERITHVVVTQAHYDHFGGAQYLADRYGARVMMSPADWDFIAADAPPNAPVRDLEIHDGQRLTVGDTTITLHHTPGHTPGTVSPVFPALWRGTRHTTMLWGGTNPPSATADKRIYLSSVRSFAARMRAAGVVAELNNHPGADYGVARMEQLRADASENPFIIGGTRTRRFMEVMESMIRGRIATDEESPTTAAPAAHTTRTCC
ncbi:MBL fold metallo-hydrolase [Streptomonospora nanhaiensis]|uniref:MBL fold metallo-hydrolase n=1 Tax=Streptomonospora nanhaiensis TaxID=1323731 RepID=UPI001C993CF1|nr:MBL fold metallo-hydrolase [Streptomonospora nanhaiensis]MBX9387051.1 MBL fold metallo-hydrolase [Streptomonospora nanhaiensis]